MSNPYTNPYGVPQAGAPPAPAPGGNKAYAPPVVYGQGGYAAPPAPYGGAPSPYGGAPPAPYGTPHYGAPQYGGGAPPGGFVAPSPYAAAPPRQGQYGGPPPPAGQQAYGQQLPQYPGQPGQHAYPAPSAGPGPAGQAHGSKRALIVGCTYPGTQSELRVRPLPPSLCGCILMSSFSCCRIPETSCAPLLTPLGAPIRTHRAVSTTLSACTTC